MSGYRIPQKTPVTIKTAFRRTNDVSMTTGAIGQFGINLSTIASILIQECGRWTERYASDFLITWRTIQDICEGKVAVDPAGYEEIFLFAIRRDGVDHTAFFMSRATEGINQWQPYMNLNKYRKVFAVRLTVENGEEAICELRDLTNQFTTLHDDDKNWGKEDNNGT